MLFSLQNVIRYIKKRESDVINFPSQKNFKQMFNRRYFISSGNKFYIRNNLH